MNSTVYAPKSTPVSPTPFLEHSRTKALVVAVLGSLFALSPVLATLLGRGVLRLWPQFRGA